MSGDHQIENGTGHEARMEEALRASEVRYRRLFEAAKDGILILDIDTGRINDVNPFLFELLGFSRSEMLGKTVGELSPFKDMESNKVMLERLQKCGYVRYEDLPLETRDGRKIAVEFVSNVYQAGDRNVIQCNVRDITERKQAKKVLSESEMLYRSLFENMVEAFAYCRMLFKDGQPQDYIYLLVNKAFENLTGLSNVAGRKASEVMPGHREADPEFCERFGRVARTGQLERFEHYNAALKKWFSVSAYCPRKGHFIAAFENITERKQAEKRMRLFSQEIVAAREEERKRVSSALHHDVGSLAVGISAYVDAIEKDLRADKPGEALKWIKRTRKLFNKSVVRLKGLAVELRPAELDVLGLRAALRQYFSQVTKRRAIKVRFKDTQWTNQSSAKAATILFRVAQEALTNAIKHGHAKQVDVDLKTSKENISLTIRDDGKGFDVPAQKARISSQLGLRVMEEMATSAGGDFMVDSGRGKGTTVRLKLPSGPAGSRLPGGSARGETRARGRTIRSAARSSRPHKGGRA